MYIYLLGAQEHRYCLNYVYKVRAVYTFLDFEKAVVWIRNSVHVKSENYRSDDV